LFAIERRKEIISIIEKENRITVSDLSKRMRVSVVTIRKDLGELEADGSVTRTYGGVILGSNPLLEKIPERKPEYSSLVLEAAKLFSSGQTIMLGGGKHILDLAEYLINYENNLTVITISIEVALALIKAPHIDVILTGGILRARTMTMLGHLTERVIKEICFDISFSEADGIHPTNGFTSSNMVEASTEAALLKFSNHPVILAEASAIGKTAPAQISKIKTGLTVIVDGLPDIHIVKQLEQNGLEIIVADISNPRGNANVESFPSSGSA
jgi:DeoR/GlpR family transcriptional regulator of sugar metabolism